jgi:hypothetical protein
MTDDRSLERAARSWIEAGPTQAPDRAVEAALLQIETTPQERDLGIPWRLPKMTTPARVATAAVIGVLAIGGAFFVLRPTGPSTGVGPGPSPTPTPTASPTPTPTASPSASVPADFPDSPLKAGTYTVAPFGAGTDRLCHAPPQAGCTETAADDAMRVTITVPDGWAGVGNGIWLTEPGNSPPDGAGLLFARGAWLLSDPCKYIDADIPVGPTVADFVDAVANHPLLDTTTPVDVALAGYSGKYFDLQIPADISKCETEPGDPSSGPIYRPWEPGIYAQGPSQRWHLWVLDVDGVRVVVQSSDYAGTPATRRAELQAIVDSIQIES